LIKNWEEVDDMERIDRKSPDVKRIAGLTGISFSRAARLLRNVVGSKFSEARILLACIFAGQAPKADESRALFLAGLALDDPEAAKILINYLAVVRKAHKYLKTSQNPEVAYFLETTIFGGWRRNIKG
jgi:hypothetical protein